MPQDLLGPQAALRIHFLGTGPGRRHLGPGAFSEAVSIRTSSGTIRIHNTKSALLKILSDGRIHNVGFAGGAIKFQKNYQSLQ